MSKRVSKAVAYKCLNDCQFGGCPGHSVVFIHDMTTDIYQFQVVTKGIPEIECFDENRWHAMRQAFESI